MSANAEYLLEGETVVGPEKFWLVVCTDARQIGTYRDGHQELLRSYKYVHESQASAEAEAWRLANKHHYYAFAVVESMAVVSFKATRNLVVWEDSYVEPRLRDPITHTSCAAPAEKT